MCIRRKNFFERLFDLAIAADSDNTFMSTSGNAMLVPAEDVTVMNMEYIEDPMIYYCEFKWSDSSVDSE